MSVILASIGIPLIFQEFTYEGGLSSRSWSHISIFTDPRVMILQIVTSSSREKQICRQKKVVKGMEREYSMVVSTVMYSVI